MSMYRDKDRWLEEDGTWSISLEPWSSRTITGFNSLESAENALDIIDEVKSSYAETMAYED